MSKESAVQFLREYRSNEEARKKYPIPKNPDEAIAKLVEISGEQGIQITAEEMAEAVLELQEELKGRTDTAVNDMEALEDDDLEDVAGGEHGNASKVYDTCVIDYTDTSCWDSDACAAAVYYYYDCSGEYFENGEEYDCSFSLYCDFALIGIGYPQCNI